MSEELSNDRLVLRRATFEDYEKVLDISRTVTHGADYIHVLYYHYIQDPNMYSYVAEYEGKVVAFQAAYMLPGNRAQLWLGARTKSGYEHLGLMKKLGLQMYTDTEITHPDIETKLWIGGGNDRQDRHLKSNPVAKILHKWGQQIFQTTPKQLEDFCEGHNHLKSTMRTKTLSYNESLQAIPAIIELYKDNNQPYIFTLPLPYLPREINYESIRQILMKNDCICTPNESGTGYDAVTIYSTIPHPNVGGIVPSMYFVGKSMALLIEHIFVYFEALCKICSNDCQSITNFIGMPYSLAEQGFEFLKQNLGDPINKNRDDIYLIGISSLQAFI